MYNKLIENYLSKLTKDDVILLAFKNNIILSPNEVDYLYKTIKNKYQILLSNNYEIIFKEANDYLKKDNIKKLYNLYLDYRNKYKNYLNLTNFDI